VALNTLEARLMPFHPHTLAHRLRSCEKIASAFLLEADPSLALGPREPYGRAPVTCLVLFLSHGLGREPVLSEAKEWHAAGAFTSRRRPGEGFFHTF
jgi:hypothetical protein